MFLWFEGLPSTPQEMSQLGLTTAALVAVGILWRDNLNLRSANVDLMKEIFQSAQALKDIPTSIAALRAEITHAIELLLADSESARAAFMRRKE